jgi:hypothetical protein
MKKINKEIAKPDPNIYKLIEIIQDQETLTSVSHEKENLDLKNQEEQKSIFLPPGLYDQ